MENEYPSTSVPNYTFTPPAATTPNPFAKACTCSKTFPTVPLMARHVDFAQLSSLLLDVSRHIFLEL